MNIRCTCGHELDFFTVQEGVRYYCPACGQSERVVDEWPLTVHQLADHRSHHITEAQLAHLRQLNKPLRALKCSNCAWPSSIGELCMLCCDMAEAIMAQAGLMQAHEAWRRARIERRMGLL